MLYHLTDPISVLGPIARKIQKPLVIIGIKTIKDLLFYYPWRHEDLLERLKFISDVEPNMAVSVRGTVEMISAARSKLKHTIITEARVRDKSGSIRIVWFNQPFIAKTIKPGEEYYFVGKVTIGRFGPELSNPIFEKVKTEQVHTARIVPIYTLTGRVTQKQLRFLIYKSLSVINLVKDYLPVDFRRRHHLIDLRRAMREIHFPTTMESFADAKRRLSFDELFLIQIFNFKLRANLQALPVESIPFNKKLTDEFIAQLPFKLTDGQKKAAWEIIQDLSKNHPMNRLLNGDVGSGKTVVAMLAAINVISAGGQTALMCPTEILATQHFLTIARLYAKTPYTIALFVSGKAIVAVPSLDERREVKRKELLKLLKEGSIHFIVGTHALIEEDVVFKRLVLVIVDEQHRFGVEQRQALFRDTKNTNAPECREESNDNKIIEKDLSYILTGIFFKVQQELGRFCRERQYGDALSQKLEKAGIKFKREYPIELAGVKSNFADFIIDDRIILELKAKSFIEKDDYYQVLRYLEHRNIQLGLVVNFRQAHLKPKRVINPKFETDQGFASFASNSHFSHRLFMPHLLSMTATPIPRTLALSLYGDLDISVLDEMPPGRLPPKTFVVKSAWRARAYERVKEEIAAGHQAFVICPLIDPSDTLGVKSVTEEYKFLKENVFKNYRIGLLHGKLKSKDKEAVMQDFAVGKLDILIATTVVEVGIDVPNATVMMIEGADRFGLSQLHQLRGRIGRSSHISYCLVFPSHGEEPSERLKIFEKTNNGFELAEKDLTLRGQGDIFGTRQSGEVELKIASLGDTRLLIEAHEAAKELLANNQVMTSEMRDYLDLTIKKVHLE